MTTTTTTPTMTGRFTVTLVATNPAADHKWVTIEGPAPTYVDALVAAADAIVESVVDDDDLDLVESLSVTDLDGVAFLVVGSSTITDSIDVLRAALDVAR